MAWALKRVVLTSKKTMNEIFLSLQQKSDQGASGASGALSVLQAAYETISQQLPAGSEETKALERPAAYFAVLLRSLERASERGTLEEIQHVRKGEALTRRFPPV